MDGFRFDPTKFIVNDGAEQDLHAHEPHGDDARDELFKNRSSRKTDSQ